MNKIKDAVSDALSSAPPQVQEHNALHEKLMEVRKQYKSLRVRYVEAVENINRALKEFDKHEERITRLEVLVEKSNWDRPELSFKGDVLLEEGSEAGPSEVVEEGKA